MIHYALYSVGIEPVNSLYMTFGNPIARWAFSNPDRDERNHRFRIVEWRGNTIDANPSVRHKYL